MYLGGKKDGVLAFLPERLHAEYHGGLLHALAEKGITLKRGQKWGPYFREHPDIQAKALNVLMDYTRQFDAAHGTGLLSSLWEQIVNQWWS
jgi:hypothetical protein